MLKITGAVMIFVACFAMGFSQGQEYRQRIRELLQLKKLLLMLRGEIKYAATPLPEAFANIAEKMENFCGTFLREVGEALETQQDGTFQQVWSQKTKSCFHNLSLTKEDKKQWEKLGTQLGYLDREMQISTIDFQVEQIEALVKQLEEEKGKKSRVCNCLGVFAGVMLNLILL